MNASLRLVVCVALAGAVFGCDEESGAGDDGKVEMLPDVTIPKDELDEWEVFRFSDLEKPYQSVDECVSHQQKEHDDDSAMSACRCENCKDIMQECDALPGCVEIRACAQKSGCTDEFTCYLFPGAPCTEVIDDWGNAGVATATSVELLNCSIANGCQ